MVVRKARLTDAPAIAALHRRRLSFGLLSQFGEEFVTRFYVSMLRSPLGFAFVAEQDGRVIGFTTGVTDWRRFSRAFLRTHLGMVARALLTVLRDGRWRRLLETLRYARATDLPPAEFVSMAVEKDFEGTGVAALLTRTLFAEFTARGITTLRITTGSANTRSMRFFEKLGLQARPLQMHPGDPAVLYIVSLDAGAAPSPAAAPAPELS